MCDTKRWKSSSRYQSRMLWYVLLVGQICHCTLSVEPQSKKPVSTRKSYLKSDKHHNPASQPVRMAHAGKLLHEPRSPRRDRPEIDSVFSARVRKRVKRGTCVLSMIDETSRPCCASHRPLARISKNVLFTHSMWLPGIFSASSHIEDERYSGLFRF